MSAVKKICVLGMFGVGKTSLVDRIAFDRFSVDYKTTIGVRPVPASIQTDSTHPQRIVLWDIAGESTISRLTRSYMVGADGFVIVMDGLRTETVEAARNIAVSCNEEFPHVPIVLLVNKSDLEDLWDVRIFDIQTKLGAHVFSVSARTGNGVRDAIHDLLARPMHP
jgi:small GTP-binding protein